MTKPTEAQIKEACDLLNEEGGTPSLWAPVDYKDYPEPRTVARLIVQRDTERAERTLLRDEYEAFKQRVSEIAKEACNRSIERGEAPHCRTGLASLIQPDPAPTPEEVLAVACMSASTGRTNEEYFANVIVELAKRGHHVAPIEEEG